MPTILDRLGMEHDGPAQGESLIPLMETGKRESDPPAISEATEFGPEQKSVRFDGFRYIYTEDPEEAQQGVSFPGIAKHAFFDLRSDPDEKKNIYDQNRELAGKYNKILEDTMAESAIVNSYLRAKNKGSNSRATKLPADVIEKMKALGYLQD